LQGNGGVLVVSDSIDFKGLVQALLQREMSVQDGWPALPLSVRVILLGDSGDYDNIPDAIFRYEAWAQDLVTWDRNTEATYAALSAGVAAYYGLPAPSPGAVARLIQEGSRRSDSINRTRLITNMLLLHDLTVEAAKLTRTRNGTTIPPEAVDAVLEQRRALQRFNVDFVHEAILTGENITPTVGTAVGQINGLAILEVHPWEAIFAIPTRISTTVAPGEGEHVLDVEREAGKTDDSHVRGLLAMEGYFIGQYGQEFSLSLAARIRFEQEQNSMGGDSASAAELFALLSALSNIPIRRSIAVTGAVGQYGEIQPIGGINFKIQGFWDLCRIRRQRGEQPEGGYGVIMPASNARDLMLRPVVAASIANEGWFQVWLANTVDEALPLLMGVPAATVHERAEQRLRHYAQLQAQGKRGR
jgi:predicted ATP-dependent protease